MTIAFTMRHPVPWLRRAGWIGFYCIGGVYIARLPYFFMTIGVRGYIRLNCRRTGRPMLQSKNGILWLRPERLYSDLGHHGPAPWKLLGGTTLSAHDPVLEIHILSWRLRSMKNRTGRDPGRLLIEELLSLVERLAERSERTIVYAQTHLFDERQAQKFFGAAARPLPESFHARWDMFFRRLTVFGYSPEHRWEEVLREPRPVYELAASLGAARPQLTKYRPRR